MSSCDIWRFAQSASTEAPVPFLGSAIVPFGARGANGA
jgi:hypothetical protein